MTQTLEQIFISQSKRQILRQYLIDTLSEFLKTAEEKEVLYYKSVVISMCKNPMNPYYNLLLRALYKNINHKKDVSMSIGPEDLLYDELVMNFKYSFNITVVNPTEEEMKMTLDADFILYWFEQMDKIIQKIIH